MRKQASVALLFTLAAAVLWAQAPPSGPAVVRKTLLQQDLAIPGGYSMLLLSVEIPPGGREGRHSHPGALAVYVQEGEITLDSEGKATATYKAGDTFFVESGKIHEGINHGSAPAKGLATLVVPKGPPVSVPAP